MKTTALGVPAAPGQHKHGVVPSAVAQGFPGHISAAINSSSRPSAALLEVSQQSRRGASVIVHSVKAFEVEDPDDLVTGWKVNPERHASKHFNLRDLLADCKDWRSCEEIMQQEPQRFERNPSLSYFLLKRLSEVIPPPSGPSRAERVRGLKYAAGVLAMVLVGMDTLRSDEVCGLPSVLAALGLRDEPALKAVLLYTKNFPQRIRYANVCEVLAGCARLKFRVPASVQQILFERAIKGGRYATAHDVADLGLYMHSLPRGGVDSETLSSLLRDVSRHTLDLPPSAIAHWVATLARQGIRPPRRFIPSAYEALGPRLHQLTDGPALVSLLFGLTTLAGGEAPPTNITTALLTSLTKDVQKAGISALSGHELALLGALLPKLAPATPSPASPAPAPQAPTMQGGLGGDEGDDDSWLLPWDGAAKAEGRTSAEEEGPSPLEVEGFAAAFVGAVRAKLAEVEDKVAAPLLQGLATLAEATGTQVPPSVGDELLALAECRLEGMPPPSLHRLSSSAAALGLEADEAFTKAFHAAVASSLDSATSFPDLTHLVSCVNTAAPPSLQLPKGPSLGELALMSGAHNNSPASKAASASEELLVTSTRTRRRRSGSQSGSDGSGTDDESGQQAVQPGAPGSASTSPQGGATTPTSNGASSASKAQASDVMANASRFAVAVAAKARGLQEAPSEDELIDLQEALEGLPGIDPQLLELPEPAAAPAPLGGAFSAFDSPLDMGFGAGAGAGGHSQGYSGPMGRMGSSGAFSPPQQRSARPGAQDWGPKAGRSGAGASAGGGWFDGDGADDLDMGGYMDERGGDMGGYLDDDDMGGYLDGRDSGAGSTGGAWGGPTRGGAGPTRGGYGSSNRAAAPAQTYGRAPAAPRGGTGWFGGDEEGGDDEYKGYMNSLDIMEEGDGGSGGWDASKAARGSRGGQQPQQQRPESRMGARTARSLAQLDQLEDEDLRMGDLGDDLLMSPDMEDDLLDGMAGQPARSASTAGGYRSSSSTAAGAGSTGQQVVGAGPGSKKQSFASLLADFDPSASFSSSSAVQASTPTPAAAAAPAAKKRSTRKSSTAAAGAAAAEAEPSQQGGIAAEGAEEAGQAQPAPAAAASAPKKRASSRAAKSPAATSTPAEEAAAPPAAGTKRRSRSSSTKAASAE